MGNIANGCSTKCTECSNYIKQQCGVCSRILGAFCSDFWNEQITFGLWRKIIKILFQFLVPILMYVFWIRTMKENQIMDFGYVQLPQEYSMDIQLENCQLIFKQINRQDYISYNYSIKTDQKITPLELNRDTQTIFLDLRNEGNIPKVRPNVKYCWMELGVPREFQIQDVTGYCAMKSHCYIVQENELFSAGQVQFVGYSNSQFNLNFRNLYATSFSYDGENGAVYLNHAVIKDQAQGDIGTQINLESGEVAIQSKEPISLEFSIPKQTICMSAPKFVFDNMEDIDGEGTSSDFQDCSMHYISEPIELFSSYLQSEGTYFNTDQLPNVTQLCNGQVQMYLQDTTEAPKQSMQISVQSGNILVNIIPEIGEIAQFVIDGQQNQYKNILKGNVFNQGFGLESQFKEKIDATQNQPSEAPGDRIENIGIGRLNMRTSNYLRFVRSSNPSYSQFRPWWLSIASASLITPPTLSIQGFLSPTMCPYTPVSKKEKKMKNLIFFMFPSILTLKFNTKQDFFQIQQFLKKYFKNENSQVTLTWPDNSPEDPVDDYQKGSGMWELSTNFYKQEKWFQFQLVGNDKYDSILVDQDQNPFITASIVFSIALSTIISMISIFFVIKAGWFFDKKRKEDLKQLQHYSKIKNVVPPIIQSNISKLMECCHFIQRILPSFDIIKEYVMFQVFNSIYSSLFKFLKLLDQKTEPEVPKLTLEDQIRYQISYQLLESQFIQLYQQFCFVTGMKQISLQDDEAQQIFSQLKFQSEKQDKEQFNIKNVFIKITFINSNDNKQQNKQESLEKKNQTRQQCMKALENILQGVDQLKLEKVKEQDKQKDNGKDNASNNIDASNSNKILKNDEKQPFQIEIGLFQYFRSKERRIRKNILEQKQLVCTQLKQNKALDNIIDVCQKLQANNLWKDQKLVAKEHNQKQFDIVFMRNKRKEKEDPLYYNNLHGLEGLKRIFRIYDTNEFEREDKIYQQYSDVKTKRQALQEVEYNNQKNQINIDYQIVQEAVGEIVEAQRAIQARWWVFHDIAHIFVNQTIAAFSVAPIILCALFISISYSPYSISEQRENITAEDFQQDFWNLPTKFDKLTSGSQVLIIYSLIFMGAFFIIDLYLNLFSGYPEIPIRRKKDDNKYGLQWIMRIKSILLLLNWALLSFYSSIIFVWCVLGAIIDPSLYLVYTSSAMTLSTMVLTQVKEIEELINSTTNMLKQISERIFQQKTYILSFMMLTGTIKSIMNKYKENGTIQEDKIDEIDKEDLRKLETIKQNAENNLKLEYSQYFTIADTSQDGQLSPEEFSEFSIKIGYPVSKERAIQIISKINSQQSDEEDKANSEIQNNEVPDQSKINNPPKNEEILDQKEELQNDVQIELTDNTQTLKKEKSLDINVPKDNKIEGSEPQEGAIETGDKQEDGDIFLTPEDFTLAIKEIQSSSILMTLSSLGISKEEMYFWLSVIVILLLLFISFIIVGVKAFSLPGQFGSVINSLLPMISGVFFGKQQDTEKKDEGALKEKVESSLNTILVKN